MTGPPLLADLDARTPQWRHKIGHTATRHVEHLSDGRSLYIPGLGVDGAAEHFTPTIPARIRLHPCNRAQLPIIAGHLDILTDDAACFVSLAHLAHHDCEHCEPTWSAAADWVTGNHHPFRHHRLLPEQPPTHLLLHTEDRNL